MSSLSHKFNRLGQIFGYARNAWRPSDVWRLLLLGYARGHSLGSADGLSQWLHRRYPTLVVRPATLSGRRLELDASDISHLRIYQEIYVENVYDLSVIPFEPAVIWDCGAHIGLFTLLASARYPEASITSFEPNPKNAHFVRRQIERNHLQCELIEAAVSVEEGTARFAVPNVSDGGHLHANNEDSSGTFEVRVLNLPEVLRKTAPASLLLKMDIEGEEMRLLPQMMPHLPQRCAIFLETHGGRPDWEAVERLMAEVGFKSHVRRERGLCIDGWAIR